VQRTVTVVDDEPIWARNRTACADRTSMWKFVAEPDASVLGTVLLQYSNVEVAVA
jgi:hypothetical protein